MNYASEILKNIFDDNAKAVIDTVDQALSDKVNDQMDEMKKGLIDSVYENDFSYMLEKKKDKKHKEEEDEEGSEEGNDKDGDGDGDFADIMMTRMMKSGMSRKAAHEKTRKHNK
jgi:hypothetical protein